ncbi:TetR family transcriptional regulator [Micromonospora pisi]|uniref:TetR family transcriptional regulator n=1 Tax=Micromonospora pisi TaxID=589240 RepID=A0A495JQV1_9ACTN|nr:TetR family transcriptional regulator [Micromonospora pisi]RKR90439.1 TetR family transcriptional regulator [Micromonospora pisi]
MTISDDVATGRRDRKKRQTRDALAAAALRLVAERGLDQVTVEEISEAADVSARTFFNYFSSKDDALLGDQAVDIARVLAALRAAPLEVPALDAVRLALAEIIDEMQADAPLWVLRMEVIERNPALLPRLVASSTETEQAMTDALATRLGLGPEHGYPALVTAVTGAAFRVAMMRWARSAGKLPLADLVDEAFSGIAAGLPDPRSAS